MRGILTDKLRERDLKMSELYLKSKCNKKEGFFNRLKKDLVKNKFKSDEQRRFAKQQLITWISIGVSALLGILGIIF